MGLADEETFKIILRKFYLFSLQKNICCGYSFAGLGEVLIHVISTHYIGFGEVLQSYRDGVWMWQEAQCSLLDSCLTKISGPRHLK